MDNILQTVSHEQQRNSAQQVTDKILQALKGAPADCSGYQLLKNPDEPFKFLTIEVDEAYKSLMLAVTYLDVTQQADILRAAHFGDMAHIHDRRKSGEAYFVHPLAVAEILAGFHLDCDTLIAALLHDTVEDTEVTLEQVKNIFGTTVAQLVDGVTKLKSEKHSKQQTKDATFIKIVKATAVNPRVLAVKLADRLHNMSTLAAVKEEKKISTAKETLAFYVPLARGLGMNDLADVIEILCYRNLDRTMYDKLNDRLVLSSLNRSYKESTMQGYLQHVLHNLGIKGSVRALNHNAAMFRQFFRNRGEIGYLLRQYSLQVVLGSVDECYALSHYLTDQYNIPESQITDHIKYPEPGNNQSLILTYQNDTDIVQLAILTREMQVDSRLGIISLIDKNNSSQSMGKAALMSLVNMVNDFDLDASAGSDITLTADSLLDHIQERKITCYSPKGHNYILPRAATALDFAYAVGPKIGNVAVAAVIDGKIGPLATVIKHSQVVEIITDPASVPSAEWLGYVVTNKARKLISRWFKSLPKPQKIEHGRLALERALTTYDQHLNKLSESDWQDLLKWQEVDSKEDLYSQISSGEVLPQLVITRLFSDEIAIKEQSKSQTHPQTLLQNVSGVEVNFAKCCNPIYGDFIAGYNASHGLMVHRHKCIALKKYQAHHPSRVFKLLWRDKHSVSKLNHGQPIHFKAYFGVEVKLNESQISDCMQTLSKMGIGAEGIELYKTHQTFHAMVTSRKQAEQGIKALRKTLDFVKVKRLYKSDRFDLDEEELIAQDLVSSD